ncbi:serine hydrolase [Aestuariivita boseongensis]|uniref:serine hydrolase n=1 Tax=Aestuariivita boseongensis TaxID=1470562 RepID=UPI0009E326B9|nr:serine hydrolase [Aestuariivita boseongensis]
MCIVVPLSVAAAPYAAMVMDARTGEVLHSRNADTRLHPASLTKMMTLYIAFEAVKNGEISLDTEVRVSKKAASEPPSKLGLSPGQRIKLRFLIRAAAVKSANDAATAIGEAISGSEAAFARRMNATAKALGMTRTTFKNAHGLTESGHLSTARDMTIMGRRLLYDYPQYYNLFSRRTTHAGIKEVSNTNRRLLAAYRGADGIKTGYTRAAGFNLVASAQRGNERVIATVFGGKSTTSRNARVAELLDLGFRRAPSRAPLRKPAPPVYASNPAASDGAAGKTIRVSGAVQKSLRPQLRPGEAEPILVAEAIVETAKAEEKLLREEIAEALAAANPEATDSNDAPDVIETIQTASLEATIRPEARPKTVVQTATTVATAENLPDDTQREVVTRLSTSGGKHWGINVGRYTSRYQAEKVLLRTALAEMSSLDGSLRKVVKGPRGFDANFHGMTRESADLACRRLQARNVSCFMIGPS